MVRASGTSRSFASALALALVACGGRAHRELSPDAARPDGGTDVGGSPPDVSELIAERCADFGLPAGELARFMTNPLAGYPIFGPCGHLTLISGLPVPIWSPDLETAVVSAATLPHFSPEGTRVAFVPGAPENDRIRRLDLVSGEAFDTVVPDANAFSTALGYGLFLNTAGDVESWVCSGTTLRIFADRVPGEAPLLEAEVPSCQPLAPRDGALLWPIGSTLTVVDLRGHRSQTLTIPPYHGHAPDLIDDVFDGYAAAPLVFSDEQQVFGPLYSMRDGTVLAERWERVTMADGQRAANRIDSGYALLVDDGRATRVFPGLRGLYVFRDLKRAFALRANESGAADLVLAELDTGATTTLAEYTSRALLETDPFGPSFAVSQHERAAYFVLGPGDDPDAPAPSRSGVVRWLDGESELLPDAVPAGTLSPAVSDNGTAVFSAITGSVRLRPGAEPLMTSGQTGYMMSADGRATVRSSWDGNVSRMLVMNLDSGVERTLVSDILDDNGESADVNHLRYAASLSFDDMTTAVWAGRFPEAD